MKMYICIDIGGTAIKYGQVSGRGEILEFHERASQANLGGPRLVANVLEILDGYLKKTEQTHGSALKGEGEKAEQNRGTAPDWDGKGRNQKTTTDRRKTEGNQRIYPIRMEKGHPMPESAFLQRE